MKNVDVVIIGGGSAGLSALRRVKEETTNYVMANHGPLGTTCARIGCMPSKVLIHVAREYAGRSSFEDKGIRGAEGLSCDIPAVMRHVRSLRDKFAGGMTKVTKQLAGDKLLEGKAKILGPDRVKVGEEEYRTRRIVIAAGSRPTVPKAWEAFIDRILTSRDIFEQEDMPGRIAAIGLGPIGLELGQALSRLGLEVTGFDMLSTIGGLTDPDVNRAAIDLIGEEFPIHVGEAASVEQADGGLRVTAGDASVVVDKIVASMGVTPNLDGLGLENLGVDLNKRGLPRFDGRSMQVGDLPVFIAGDVSGCRPILHEALDEGFIAGKNCFVDEPERYCRRTPLKIVFSDPQIAGAGQSFASLEEGSFVAGVADFSGQARAMVEGRNRGLLHLYAERETARVVGAEMAVPDGEHLAHVLALAMENEMTVGQMLHMPFYHPTIEEGLRSALRDAAQKLKDMHKPEELSLCESCPETPVC